MKILVFMSDNRPLENDIEKADYNSLVACINSEYCKRRNYDFIYYRPYLNDPDVINLYNCLDPHTNELRHAAWSKLLSTSKALELHYDYIVYIDSDCIFKDFNKSLEDLIHCFSNNDVIFFNNKPWNIYLPCSGFYVCKVSEHSKQFLIDWYNENYPERNKNHSWEQSALWRIYDKYNLVRVDSMMFSEEEGQFLRHISSCESNIRISYFKTFMGNKNINYKINHINVINYNTISSNSCIEISGKST